MFESQIFYMKHYNIRKTFFVDCYTNNVEQSRKIDKFLDLLDKSGVCELFESLERNYDKGGRPVCNMYNLLATILFDFTFDKGTLRDIEARCKYDLRYIYIMQNDTPTHTTFGSFINDYLVPNQEKIFSLITKAIFDECGLKMDNIFIDGSKFEANANKYKFVWKPTKFHINLSNKIILLLSNYGLDNGLKNDEIISSQTIAEKLSQLNDKLKELDLTLKENKAHKKNYDLMLEYLNKSLEYEEKERICGSNRNSYYKTDYDATAMCLKEDYYSGLGSNMHAAYNTQIGVINGLITVYLVTQSRADLHDFIPLLDKLYSFYNAYPEGACADAGYGSLENYQYLDEHNIKNYVKYFSWEGNVSGRNPNRFTYNKDTNTIVCLNKKIGYEDKDNTRHHKKANSKFYKIEGCNTCPFSAYCKRYMKNKNEDFKIFEINIKLQEYIQQSEDNLLSIKGIEMRVNRSSQVEGAFGVIKQDLSYNRFRRRTLTKVSAEFMLVCLGYNIRKLFKYYDGKNPFKYWKAPEGLETETPKKPSAKRLTNRALKVKNKSVNEIAKFKSKK